MQIQILKSKLHRAMVTGGNVQYEGSLTIDAALMERAGMHPYERILCGNLANGERFETYLIPGERASGDIILNGATAHLGKPGDLLTIMCYTWIEEAQAKTWQPKVLVLGKRNTVVDERGI
jgi:aspartate 1-decarboxylase